MLAKGDPVPHPFLLAKHLRWRRWWGAS